MLAICRGIRQRIETHVTMASPRLPSAASAGAGVGEGRGGRGGEGRGVEGAASTLYTSPPGSPD